MTSLYHCVRGLIPDLPHEIDSLLLNNAAYLSVFELQDFAWEELCWMKNYKEQIQTLDLVVCYAIRSQVRIYLNPLCVATLEKLLTHNRFVRKATGNHLNLALSSSSAPGSR